MVSFSIQSNDSQARLGTLTTSYTTLHTPSVLLHTKDGNPPYMTPDILSGISEAQAMHISISDVVELREVLTRYGQGAHKFFNLRNYALFLSFRDPLSFVDCPAAQEDSITVTPRKGNTKLSTQHFQQLIQSFKLDMFTPMFFDATWDASKKRARKAVDLALHWLDAILPKLSDEEKAGIFGVIEGSNSLELRVRSATETAKRSVAGFVLGGLDVGESSSERVPIVRAVLEKLPAEKPRAVIGPGSPEEILDLVEQGVDLFSNSYPFSMTEQGYALTFALDAAHPKRDRKLNVRDAVYVIDKRPVLEGCGCFACQNHTRAYLHHLTNVNEMLGEVLLQIHNTYHYLELFKTIRRHIQNGTFAEFKKWFLDQISPENFAYVKPDK